MSRQILIFGGAGFLGSHVVRRFVSAGDRVIVVDALVAGTGGSLDHLGDVRGQIEMRTEAIEQVDSLPALVGSADLVIDAMAWTRHVAAMADPLRDMRLNLASHITLLQALRAQPPRLLVYLGSRSQYGRMASGVITEDTPMAPQDPQGVHKVATETHFKNFAALDGFNVVSLRLPNCFGESQPVSGEDIGLVGGFIRSLCQGATIKVYGAGRRRAILYARDVAEIVARVVDQPIAGFVPLNVAGHDVDIREIATRLQAIAGAGAVADEAVPAHVKAMDTGDATIDQSRLEAMIGAAPRTDLADALDATVGYFKEQLS